MAEQRKDTRSRKAAAQEEEEEAKADLLAAEGKARR